jgi:DNA-binding beta-propeller fold protein YncE
MISGMARTATRWACEIAVSLTLLFALSPARTAQAEADELMPGSVFALDAARSVLKFVARPAGGTFDLPDLPANSPATVGATIEFFDTVAPGAGANVLQVSNFGWRSLATGWSYRDPGQSCRVRVKPTVVSAKCRFEPTLAPPIAGDVQVIMTIGTKRYCATFGGATVASRPLLLRRRGAAAGPCQPLPCGRFVAAWGSFGTGDGEFNQPDGIAVDSAGHVFVGELGNNRIQKFDANGTFLTKWGGPGSGDGQFAGPDGVAVDASGNVYVADLMNYRVQKFDGSGTFLTKWGSLGSGDGQFNRPAAIAVDGSGNVYVVEFFGNRVQKFDGNGTFLAKWGTVGTADGQFVGPEGIAIDASGNVYVADLGNDRIQKFDASGTFLTKWGIPGRRAGGFDTLIDVAVDPSGNVYATDLGQGDLTLQRIQKFDGNGTFLTMWGGSGGHPGQFAQPAGLATDASGHLYVTEFGNARVQKFACP